MSRRFFKGLLTCLLLLCSYSVIASPTLMIRTTMGFEVAMQVLRESVEAHGYKVAHVQKCDGGMAQFDYKTDFYRVVFLGKLNEVRNISAKYPEMIPLLPLKIALFAEEKETVVVALDPIAFSRFYPQPDLKVQFQRWSSDLTSILADIRDSK